MEPYEPYASILTAVGIGLLIGLERERSGPGSGELPLAAGVRTFALVAMLGAGGMLLTPAVGPWLVAGGLLGVVLLVGLAYRDGLERGADRGMTSEVALLVAYLVGALCLTDSVFPSSSAKLITAWAFGVGTTVLLSGKSRLHDIAGALTRTDLDAALKFLVAAVIILPLLPDRTYGPLDVLNPFHVGTMIVLIAGTDFAGYVAVRVLGPDRGLGLTGLLGGLVSSTAVTLAMAARARKEQSVTGACAFAAVLASSIMLVRVVLLVAIVQRSLVPAVIVPFGVMSLAALVVAVLLYLRSRRSRVAKGEEIRFTNPFELGSAVKFGILFALVLLVSKAASVQFGAAGAYVTGLVSGLADVDPITLSMARLAETELSPRVAATTITIAAMANTAVKGSIAAIFGGWPFGRLVLVSLGVVFAAGGLGLLLVWSLD